MARGQKIVLGQHVWVLQGITEHHARLILNKPPCVDGCLWIKWDTSGYEACIEETFVRREDLPVSTFPVTRSVAAAAVPEKNYLASKALQLDLNIRYSELLKDTDGTTRRGSFLELIDDDRKVLEMLHHAYKKVEKNKLKTVGRFGNLRHFNLETAGFPVGLGDTFSSFKKEQLKKKFSEKIRQELLHMGCKFYCCIYIFLMASAKRLLLYLPTLLLSPL
jgi:hypothetical protein